ncbi:MAG: hypothetical protein ACKO5K_12025 [Armatimonadota bacterium]
MTLLEQSGFKGTFISAIQNPMLYLPPLLAKAQVRDLVAIDDAASSIKFASYTFETESEGNKAVLVAVLFDLPPHRADWCLSRAINWRPNEVTITQDENRVVGMRFKWKEGFFVDPVTNRNTYFSFS